MNRGGISETGLQPRMTREELYDRLGRNSIFFAAGEQKADVKVEANNAESKFHNPASESKTPEKAPLLPKGSVLEIDSSKSALGDNPSYEDLPNVENKEDLATVLAGVKNIARDMLKKLGPLKYIIWGTAIILADTACSVFFMGSGTAGLEIGKNVWKKIPREELEKVISDILNENIQEALSKHPEDAALLAIPGACNLLADLTTLTVTGEMSEIMMGKLGGDLTGWKKVLYVVSLTCGILHYDTLASPDGAMLYQGILSASNWGGNPIFGVILSQVVTLVLGVPYYVAADDGLSVLSIKSFANLRWNYSDDWKWWKHIPEVLESVQEAAAVLAYRLGLNEYSNNSYFVNVANLPKDHPVVVGFSVASNIAGAVRISTTRLVKPMQAILQFKPTLGGIPELREFLKKNPEADENFSKYKQAALVGINLIQAGSLFLLARNHMSPWLYGPLVGLRTVNKGLVTYKTELCKAILAYEEKRQIPREDSRVLSQLETADNEAKKIAGPQEYTEKELAEALFERNRKILKDLVDVRKKSTGIDILAYILLYTSRFGLRLVAQPANVAAMNIAFGLGLTGEEIFAVAMLFGVPSCFNEAVNFSPLVGKSFGEYSARSNLDAADRILFPEADRKLFPRGKYFTFIEECDTERLEAAAKKLNEDDAAQKSAASNAGENNKDGKQNPAVLTSVNDSETGVVINIGGRTPFWKKGDVKGDGYRPVADDDVHQTTKSSFCEQISAKCCIM